MLSERDRQLVTKLIEELTGGVQNRAVGQDTLISNVERRMSDLQVEQLPQYLKLVDSDPEELNRLVSSLTIHTTSWFRENPHFVAFQEILLEALNNSETFKVWCAACSTGEEVYSFGLMLEEFRRIHPKFEYRILGTDLDVISLRTAEQAVYLKKSMGFHVRRYESHILEGHGKTEGYFTMSKAIRDRCRFRRHDLRQSQTQSDGPFHLVICRNVLIYFPPDTVARVIGHLVSNLGPQGRLMLGHSETIDAKDFGLKADGHSIYSRFKATGSTVQLRDKYRILSIDDSATMRRYLSRTLTGLGFESITVSNVSEATTFLNFNEVDIITLDLEMPEGRGDKWLESERREGLRTPVIVISDVHESQAKDVIDLLQRGAQDYIEKSELTSKPDRLKDAITALINSQNHTVTESGLNKAEPSKRPDVILIGASTGGPQALAGLLERMPSHAPPIVVTQHIAPKFARPMAERLASISNLILGESEDGTPLQPGHVYLANGDHHIGIQEIKGQLSLTISHAPDFNGHRPSVDFLFNSAIGLKFRIMAILLTGMGRDGALGLRFLRKEGAFCIAQSERDCVVYGMPKEAIERGGAEFVGTIPEIRMLLDKTLFKK
ncbi:MAG: chemotaxis protein CheB [Bdellovibrionales bacterium]